MNMYMHEWYHAVISCLFHVFRPSLFIKSSQTLSKKKPNVNFGVNYYTGLDETGRPAAIMYINLQTNICTYPIIFFFRIKIQAIDPWCFAIATNATLLGASQYKHRLLSQHSTYTHTHSSSNIKGLSFQQMLAFKVICSHGPMITQCFFVFSPLWLDEMQRYITAFTSHTQNSKSQFRIWSLKTKLQLR